MRLKCFESTDSNGIEQYLIPLENGSFISIPKERISCLMMEQGIDCENCPRRFTCHEQPIIRPKHGEWIALEVLKEILIDVKQEHSNSLEATSVVNDIWHEVRVCGADMRESN